MAESDLEASFKFYLRLLAPELPPPEQEYRWHPTRRYQADFSYPDHRLLIEVQGSVHRTKERFYTDCERMNEAVLLGWRILYVTGRMLREDPDAVFAMLKAALKGGDLRERSGGRTEAAEPGNGSSRELL